MFNVCYIRVPSDPSFDGVECYPFHKLNAQLFPPLETFEEAREVLLKIVREYEEYSRLYDAGLPTGDIMTNGGYGISDRKFVPEHSLGIMATDSPFVMCFPEANYAEIDYHALGVEHGPLKDGVAKMNGNNPGPRGKETIKPEPMTLAERMRKNKK